MRAGTLSLSSVLECEKETVRRRLSVSLTVSQISHPRSFLLSNIPHHPVRHVGLCQPQLSLPFAKCHNVARRTIEILSQLRSVDWHGDSSLGVCAAESVTDAIVNRRALQPLHGAVRRVVNEPVGMER